MEIYIKLLNILIIITAQIQFLKLYSITLYLGGILVTHVSRDGSSYAIVLEICIAGYMTIRELILHGLAPQAGFNICCKLGVK